MARRSRDISRHRWLTAAQLLVASAGMLAMAGIGCSSESDDDSGGSTGTNGQCLSDREYFAKNVWGPVMGETCIKCHGPDGVAADEGAGFSLLPSAYPGFIDANLENAKQFAKTEFDGKSIILRKPLGEMEHGGGKVLEPGSPAYDALVGFVNKVKSNDNCSGGATALSYEDVAMLDALETARKAGLQLVGRLPTAQEIDTLLAKGEAGLDEVLSGMLQEDAFYDRLEEMWNDTLLTDRYLGYSSYALNLLNKTQYPNSEDDNLDDTTKTRMNQAVGREPLKLISHIVRNEKPFTEILTADYTVMNPYSAQAFNSKVSFNDPNDTNEWKESKIIVLGDTSKGEPAEMTLPHAGVLTSPVFLNRFPTSPTNLNRHRARMVFKMFLATDILKIAERPIDPTESTAYANPTREDKTCNVCHKMIDPIAGAFQKFDDNDQEKFEPNNGWHQEMFPPGYGKEVMETTDYPQALQWLAQRVVSDPRFSLSIVYTMFHALTGQEPLSYPAAEAEDFENQLKSWEAQDDLFRKMADLFVQDNYNLKTVVKAIIMSPYFRAENATGPLSPQRATQLANLGTGRLLHPEVLARKIQAVTGLPWGKLTGGYYGGADHQLLGEYRVLYGGIDSEDVTERLDSPNGVMANVAWRMANEMSCKVTAWEFSLDKQAERHLFPYVTMEDTPDTNATAIKKNIQYLHGHVLGEALQLGDAELERTYKLFEDTWKEGTAKITSEELNENIAYNCRARKNPYTDTDLPDADRLEKDPEYTVRAWQAVITYLLSDYKFLYE